MKDSVFGARLFRCCALAILCIVAGAAHAARSQQWTITDLGGAAYNRLAYAINNAGEVTGWMYVPPEGSSHHGFLWRSGVTEDLGVPAGAFGADLYGMNNRDMMVGTAGNGFVAFWKRGTWTVLDVHGQANDVNDHDVMVGGFWAGSESHAFMYRDGVLFDIGTLGGAAGVAWAINKKETITGYSYTAGSQVLHAFVYENGVMRDLGTLGGANSYAYDINNDGTVVGASHDASGRLVAMIYDRSGMRKLFDASGNYAAKAINDRGAVVGSMETSSFLYDDGVLTRLESIPAVIAAGWTRLNPMGINDRGWIVGVGSRADGAHAFVLKPRTTEDRR